MFSIDPPSTIKGCTRYACVNFTKIITPKIQRRSDEGRSSSSRNLIRTRTSLHESKSDAKIREIMSAVKIKKIVILSGFCATSVSESIKEVTSEAIIRGQYTRYKIQHARKGRYLETEIVKLYTALYMKYVLVPLGNPGDSYKRTRHNVARIVSEMVDNTFACELLVPDTFMNESGKAVYQYLKYHDDTDVIVMYDDKDLPFGKLRISYDRGDGGHNGVKSVIQELGKKDFIRIRIGIAHPETDGKEKRPLSGDTVQKYVMAHCTDDEILLLKKLAPTIKASVETIVKEGYQKAMEIYN